MTFESNVPFNFERQSMNACCWMLTCLVSGVYIIMKSHRFWILSPDCVWTNVWNLLVSGSDRIPAGREERPGEPEEGPGETDQDAGIRSETGEVSRKHSVTKHLLERDLRRGAWLQAARLVWSSVPIILSGLVMSHALLELYVFSVIQCWETSENCSRNAPE